MCARWGRVEIVSLLRGAEVLTKGRISMNEKEWDEVMYQINVRTKQMYYKQLNSTYIPVTVRNENDWEFATIFDGTKTRLAVF